ncbi:MULTISPECIES: aconitate hydratase AcnA [unclassified Thalassospira]|uniref:aconitate hydratase AcnA n=1 Tax=unclassified Thalassospira TaxID=2648997 RepID=UPI001B25CD79|nr:aconitate hydratase AcnA [Thalassospira sp.]MBO6773551.1 aconitate hydratase AcnA [Thalassospira sp.]
MSRTNPHKNRELDISGKRYLYMPISEIAGCESLPIALKVVLENQLRHAHRHEDHAKNIDSLVNRRVGEGIPFFPARVFLQDLLGVPLMVDLASLRDAVAKAGGNPSDVNPRVAADLVIDHSLRVDVSASDAARKINLELEHERNVERFGFLRWCQTSFDKLRVVPPGKGIMHQINMEYLGKVIWTDETDDGTWAYPDTLVGTDSHTTMINGLGILGWGVGGIEAEAVMLGRAVSLPIPEVVGVEITGTIPEGVMPTDIVLAITERLRAVGVVGKFVEFFGKGLDGLPVADRGTIANMAPEFGATCVYFPPDERLSDYLRMTGRTEEHIALVEAYAKAQLMWRDSKSSAPVFEQVVQFDLSEVESSIAGPWRPEDRISLSNAKQAFQALQKSINSHRDLQAETNIPSKGHSLKDGDIVIAAITSCTNTSNPINMIGAGLLAKRAAELGLTVKPWVKTSLAPGSQVVAAILENTSLQSHLDKLGFQVVGFGCTTCNGMSGPIDEALAQTIDNEKILATAVLSGNRNFEGRTHPNVRAAYLASPALVVAYAIAGNLNIDLRTEPLGQDRHGTPVFLADIWPSATEISSIVSTAYDPKLFVEKYSEIFDGDDKWVSLSEKPGSQFSWKADSTYIRQAPYFDELSPHRNEVRDIKGMRPLVILGDSITTDHISPSGAIDDNSAAANFMVGKGVQKRDFNSYGTRRGNHEIAVRATFANIRLKNKIVAGTEGSITKLMPEGEQMSVYDAAEIYKQRNVPLVVVAGKNYGCGSSRDWAAKGVALLNVKAVIAESFERIHRTNLVGMGVLPLELPANTNANTLQLDGTETFDLLNLEQSVGVRSTVQCLVHRENGDTSSINLTVRIETEEELEYWLEGGILPAVWREYVSTVNA